MGIAWIAGLCLLLSVAAWLLLFPAHSDALSGWLGRWRRRLANWQVRWLRRSASAASESTGVVKDAAVRVGRDVSRLRFVLLGLLLVVATPSLLVLALRGTVALDGFESINDASNSQITYLLRGEQLVPPPALPPAVFTTREVELVRPKLADASRLWTQLDPDFQQRLLAVYQVMRDQYGYNMALLEGYRSPERQNMLAASGDHVTNARMWQSYHQYGLAADSAFFRDGKLVISEKDPWAMRGYQLYGQLAEQAGLTWGGRWRLMDFGHVELRRRGVLGKRPETVKLD